MRLTSDKRMHLAGGLLCALAVLAIIYSACRFGVPVTLILAGPACGYGLEVYQKVRNEGQFEHADAWYTASPFFVAAVVMWGLLR